MALEAWFRVEPSQLVLRQNGRRDSGARRRAWRWRGARRDSAIPVRPRRQRRSDTAREEGEDHSVQAQLSFFSFSSSSSILPELRTCLSSPLLIPVATFLCRPRAIVESCILPRLPSPVL